MQITITPIFRPFGTSNWLFDGIDVVVSDHVMTGSPRQVAYATDVRDASVTELVATTLERQAAYIETRKTSILNAEIKTHMETLIAKANNDVAKVAASLGRWTQAKDWLDAATGSKTLLTALTLCRRK